MAAVEPEKKVEEEEQAVKGGELLFCGATAWDAVGRRKGLEGNLISPTRLRPLIGINISFVASGCTSCHCVALDVDGRCYTWGRNEKGQLGHGDKIQRDRPTVVSGLSKHKVITAGAGRSHTVVVTEDGDSLAFGWNKHGQLGTGSAKNEVELSPVRCHVSDVSNTACGADFTVWLTSVEGASIVTAGLPQYGQLGHGTDNEYNTKDSSVRLAYEAQPRPRAVASLAGETIVKVACGTNHTVAVDKNGYVYTWGFGGYGRLGHREQKDEWVPRRVDVFTRHNVLPPDAVVSAGSVNSACTAGGGQLYMWGKIKNTGDDWMYPKPLMDLSGWHLRCMDSGGMHHFVGADRSCISWGHAQSGELGYGPEGQKSSAVPKKVDILEGMHVISVASGFAHSMVVVDRTNVDDRLEQLDVYDGKASFEANEEPQNNTLALKKAKKGAENSKKRKNSKDLPESEEDGESSDDASDEDEGKLNGQAENKRKQNARGRGKSIGKSSGDKKGSGRGRGRPSSAKKSSESTPAKSGKRGRPQKS
ncbi:protein RCC2 homolog [Coffea eugenioides]|uniref:protein RCC2 homolog n=1 Tax=Coffea eugenioides TaxID=49369 RepID=UPI000F609827|nr:protein RCC2 homolog [Coffea eugenioides]XP_027149004.1 protein RCC2 homolog [Coffea eugenioides]XP_027149006.1 protein RCC2 homolog [Coffea eugenioides]